MLAYCGTDCGNCPIYTASMADDDKLRDGFREFWRKRFGFDIPREQINCEACRSNGAKFFICKLCPVRECALQRGLDSCALCDDFTCEKARRMAATMPVAADVPG